MTTATTRTPISVAPRAINPFENAGRLLAFGIVVALVTLIAPSTGVSAQSTSTVVISEVHPSGSSNGTYNADWIEITNTGSVPLDITGWKMDDNSNAFADAVAFRGITSIPAGRSAVFVENSTVGMADSIVIANFSMAWFGSATPPAGLIIGAYGGSGVGLGGGGDAVNIFDASGNRVTGVSFGGATATATFDNAAGLGSATLPLPAVSTLSVAGVNGAFLASNGAETGSPGRRANPLSTVDLSLYLRIGRFDLPEPTRTPAPVNSLLAQEVSAVTYNRDTSTLFVVGDGGTSIVQVSKTGQLIDSMTLAPGSSPQGTEFYDPEGLTYVGDGKFVMVEERDRRAVLFTYAAGSTLTRADAQTVALGTFVPNIGIEGISYDPLTDGFIAVKETAPQGIFQTGIDFAALTATNGSATTENSVDLFDPALANMLDFADVFALSNLQSLSGPESGHLLVLSQESGKIVNIDRNGNISSSLTIVSDPGNPLSVAAQQHEGLTMDDDGYLYVVSENGGGDFDHPQLWVYAPSSVPNQAPAALALTNQLNTIAEHTSTAVRIKVADVVIADDGLGTNSLTVTGPDAGFFQVDSNGLYIAAGTILDFETKSSYGVTVEVDDPTVGATPDATASYTLTLTDVVEGPPSTPSLVISEVAPWGSGDGPYAADWFEVTNTGTGAVDLTDWKVDDSSNAFASALLLNGVTSIAPGESVIFMESANPAATAASFLSTWFGASPPAGLQIGSYSGSGIGLSTGGDAVNLFDGAGVLRASVSFGASPSGPFPSFDNTAGLNNSVISQLSVVGVNGAFAAANDAAEIGSPGNRGGPEGTLVVTEVAPWSSGNSPVGADWFEVTNTGAGPVDISGWKVDDSSESPVAAVPLSGITSIAPGESVIFIETANLAAAQTAFLDTWFGAHPPAGLQIGGYSGSGIGLSTGGDAVNLYTSAGVLKARVFFGPSSAGPSFPTFDNAAGLNNAGISQLSVAGVNGAFVAANDVNEIGSPGTIVTPIVLPNVVISEVTPWGSGDAPYAADWFELTNTGAVAVNLTGWKMDDNSNAFGSAVALRGVASIPAGMSAIFLEGTADGSSDAALTANFSTAWFGSATPPAGFLIGFYGGSGVGLSTGGDAVNIFDAAGTRITGVSFAASIAGITFDNAAGVGSATLPLPTISTLSVAGVNGAFVAADGVETGSPGITIADTTPPTIDAHADVVVSAIDGSGAIATYTPPAAHDDVDLSVAVTCEPASGGQFPLGSTTVTCHASDAALNAAAPVTFTVNVVDTTPPVLEPFADIMAPTTGLFATVTFAPSATDNVSAPANIVISCEPPSGAAFPIGATLVSCTALDEAGNESAAVAFTVTVNHLPDALPDAASTLEGTAVTIPVLANDTDSVGDTLTLASVGTPAHGSAAIGAGGVVYTPAADFYGTDTFQYVVSDNHGGSAFGTVTVFVSRLGRFVALSRDLTWMRAGSTAVTGDVGAIERRHANHGDDEDTDDGDRDDVTVRIGRGATLQQPSSRVVGDTVLLLNKSSVYNVIDNFLLARKNSTIRGTETSAMTVPFVALPAFPAVQAGTQTVTVAKNKTLTLAPGKYGAVRVAAGGTLILSGGLYQMESIDLAASAAIVFRAATELRVKTDLVSRAKAKLILDPSVPGLKASNVVIYVAGRDEDCQRIESDDDGDDAGPVSVHIGAQNVVQANIYAARGTVWLKSKTVATGAFIGVHVRIGLNAVLTLDSAFK